MLFSTARVTPAARLFDGDRIASASKARHDGLCLNSCHTLINRPDEHQIAAPPCRCLIYLSAWPRRHNISKASPLSHRRGGLFSGRGIGVLVHFYRRSADGQYERHMPATAASSGQRLISYGT